MTPVRSGWLLAAGLFAAGLTQAGEPLRLNVSTDARSTTVAGYRLHKYLASRNCEVELGFNQRQAADLVYRPAVTEGRLVLTALNRVGELPVPVWVTRKTAGVGSLAELEGRGVSLIAGADPLSGSLALAALAQQGVRPDKGQRYEAGDFSSALGLLLHNNTHAAVSELGLVTPFLEAQGLTITWQGAEVSGAGWYAEQPLGSAAGEPCLAALADLKRSDDRQIFIVFPEWVHGFARTGSPH
ncbi:hypothetical protein [Marinobacter fuscus]|uniref:hypothetical protein n=1 Tax=Marinobacter fuscus TaxID=2109942 RepID=UPI00197D9DC1|nr:hypothetical protein [Marinobacter fuscus]